MAGMFMFTPDCCCGQAQEYVCGDMYGLQTINSAALSGGITEYFTRLNQVVGYKEDTAYQSLTYLTHAGVDVSRIQRSYAGTFDAKYKDNGSLGDGIITSQRTPAYGETPYLYGTFQNCSLLHSGSPHIVAYTDNDSRLRGDVNALNTVTFQNGWDSSLIANTERNRALKIAITYTIKQQSDISSVIAYRDTIIENNQAHNPFAIYTGVDIYSRAVLGARSDSWGDSYDIADWLNDLGIHVSTSRYELTGWIWPYENWNDFGIYPTSSTGSYYNKFPYETHIGDVINPQSTDVQPTRQFPSYNIGMSFAYVYGTYSSAFWDGIAEQLVALGEVPAPPLSCLFFRNKIGWAWINQL